MKNTILLLLAVLAIALPASAQRSSDLYGAPRSVIVAPPQNFIPGNATVTNGAIDVRMFDGLAKITFLTATNTGTTGGTLTASLWGSSDTTGTNLTAISYALSSNVSVNYTNSANTNYVAINTYVLPGTWVTPSPATAGWASPYLLQAPFTNTGAITLTGKNFYEVGVSVGDAPRYLYIIWTAAGSATNFTGGALLTGATHSSQLY